MLSGLVDLFHHPGHQRSSVLQKKPGRRVLWVFLFFSLENSVCGMGGVFWGV